MDYQNYKNSRNLAWEVLLKEGVCELPVSVSKLCKQMNITLAYGVSEAGSDGFSTVINGEMYIIIREGMSTERTRFTAAHELGHILLGHVGRYYLVNREPTDTDSPIEQATNVFASRLLAPACVLWGCGVRTPTEIAQLCSISFRAAQIRAKRMDELYARNRFLVSLLEQKVFEQFQPFISSHRQQALTDPAYFA